MNAECVFTTSRIRRTKAFKAQQAKLEEFKPFEHCIKVETNDRIVIQSGPVPVPEHVITHIPSDEEYVEFHPSKPRTPGSWHRVISQMIFDQ